MSARSAGLSAAVFTPELPKIDEKLYLELFTPPAAQHRRLPRAPCPLATAPPAPMDALPIIIPLPELSGEDAIELSEFLYQLAGRFEAFYRDAITRYYRDADQYRAEQRDQMLPGADPVPLQLELFEQLEAF